VRSLHSVTNDSPWENGGHTQAAAHAVATRCRRHGVVAVTSNTYPMRRRAFGWVLIAPLVSLLFHFRIEPKPDPTMVAAHSMDIGAVANPAIGAPSGLR
jgi:hypothetical protein